MSFTYKDTAPAKLGFKLSLYGRIINISLGGELQNKKLVDIPNEYLIKELKYDLTLSYEGRNINSYDISKCFNNQSCV